jgi:sporulation protein YlmC with PRC-barrel domain
MTVVKKIVEGHELGKIMDLPLNMKNKRLEVVISVVEEKNVAYFDPKPFRGILNIPNIEKQIEKLSG